MFVALTNGYTTAQKFMEKLPWVEGTTVCNILKDEDC
jgi:hypothetical protein